ncbi:MAG: mitochondrial fission ELM1 family protein [Xanthomonadaceae bacterium]|nr:mitochondrial fission ELM1 family protein [Xanthomonadaceae bacterium]
MTRAANRHDHGTGQCATGSARCRPTGWILGAPGAGDNRQLACLAETLDIEARQFDSFDPVWRVIKDRLAAFRVRQIPADKFERYSPPWPDVILIAGGRSVVDARAIRNASGGHSRIICIGRPWAPLKWLDLVITTPQYRLPAADNVLCVDLPLNLPRVDDPLAIAHWRRQFHQLPKPMLGVLLGGDSGSFRFTRGCASRLARTINARVAAAGGSAVITASPRTPAQAVDTLERALKVPSQIFRWHAGQPNPFSAMLKLADALLVTSDSASMLAEACYSGKTTAAFHLHERARARCLRALRPTGAGQRQWTDRLTRHGLWVPARDLYGFGRQLESAGWLVDDDQLFESRPTNKLDVRSIQANVRERVLQLLDRVTPGDRKPDS